MRDFRINYDVEKSAPYLHVDVSRNILASERLTQLAIDAIRNFIGDEAVSVSIDKKRRRMIAKVPAGFELVGMDRTKDKFHSLLTQKRAKQKRQKYVDEDEDEPPDMPRTEVLASASMQALFEAAYDHAHGENVDDEIVDHDPTVATILVDARNSTESIRDFCKREFRGPNGEAIHISTGELEDILPVKIIEDEAQSSE